MKTATIANRVKKLIKNKKNSKALPAAMQPPQPVSPDIFAQNVEKKAYELFEQRGCQGGNDWDDWFKAEAIVEEEMISGKC